MKSGFIELVVKKTLAGRSVETAPSRPRYRPIHSFKKYMENILPAMEEATEIHLLKKNLNKIKAVSVRKELVNAYMRRLFRLRTYEKEELKSYKKPISEPTQNEVVTTIDPSILKHINEHNEYDIGSFCLFTQKDMETVFKHGSFGFYSDEEFAFTKKFGIQIREECLSITSLMKLIDKTKDKKVDWNAIKEMSHEEKIRYLNDEQNYPKMFMELSRLLYKKVHSQYEKEKEYSRIWGSSVISDTIINSILQNEEALNDPINIMYTVAENLMKEEISPSSMDFVRRFPYLPGYDSIKTKQSVPQNASYYSQTPSFKSIFLGGLKGNGKSMVLHYLAMWAHKNNWIVLNVPNCYKWTQNRKGEIQRCFNGLYLMNKEAVEWLDQFITANESHLINNKVDMSLYGKHDIAGIREDLPDPIPEDFYYEDRKTYFNEISKKFKKRLPEQERKEGRMRITNVLKEPKNLLQICKAGINHPEYATCAMGEILSQIYQLETPILECVDAFSWFYRPSLYPSFRYFNDRGLFGKVPPYHIANCRMFVNLDGHKLKNGLKVVTSNSFSLYNHKFDIKQMMFPECYEHKMRNLNHSQFAKAVSFNVVSGWWQADDIQKGYMGYGYTITQGNWGDFQDYMKNGYYY